MTGERNESGGGGEEQMETERERQSQAGTPQKDTESLVESRMKTDRTDDPRH